MALCIQPDMVPAFDTPSAASPTGTRQRKGLLRRIMPRGYYSPVGVEQGTAPPSAQEAAPIAPAADDAEKPRRGWLRRRPRWNNLGGASRLAGLSRSLRWKRLSGISVSLKGSWASALLDTVAFRVMYVVEAVVLGLALSCFFCCCGCQI